jgi:hypothetical protein
VTLQSTAARASSLIGPAIAGLAIATYGEAAPYFLHAAMYLPLMAALVPIRRLIGRLSPSISSFRGDLVDGFRRLREEPLLNGLLRLELVFALLQANTVIITIVAVELLGAGPEGLGLLLAAPSLGAVLGITGLLGFGPVRRQGRFVIVTMVAYAATLVMFAVSTAYALSFIVLALNGMFDAFLSITRNSMVQLAAPARMRGRLMANMATVSRGISPISEAVSGLLAGAVGARFALAAAAAGLAVAAGVTARGNRAVWAFAIDAERAPDAAAHVDAPLIEDV